MNKLVKQVRTVLKDEAGQTTLEWIALSIMIAMTIVIVFLALQNGLKSIIDAIVDKLVALINAISL